MQLERLYPNQIQQLSLELEVWTDNDILLLMDGVLRTSLEQLNDLRASEESVREAYEWMMADEILPFSFAVCCRAVGYDHERLRDAVLASLKRIPH